LGIRPGDPATADSWGIPREFSEPNPCLLVPKLETSPEGARPWPAWAHKLIEECGREGIQDDLDQLKLEAKHTIELVRFVDVADVDSRYFEKPYYVVPDGDEAREGFVVMRDALNDAKKMAIGQLIMNGREHVVGIKAHGALCVSATRSQGLL
jgi:Ku70/Ku80-like protein